MVTIGAALGMYAQDSETEDDETVSSTGIDVYGLVEYLPETIDLRFTGEYLMLGAPIDVEGVENNDGSVMTVAGGAAFGLQGDMITAITPMIRYERQISPATQLPEGADDPEDNYGAIVCANFHMGSHNTTQLGIRNYSFQAEGTDGYTDFILDWVMSF